MKFTKILPYAALAIALVGLWLQYQAYKKHDCDCNKEPGSGMIEG